MNGVTGKVLDVAYRTSKGKPEVQAVIVKFDDDEIGQQCRKENLNFHTSVKNHNGVPIFKTKFSYKAKRHGSLMQAGKEQWLIQFPLSLAFASTGMYHFFINLTFFILLQLCCSLSEQK